jgi:branched-chain amino acid transport system permease protein
VTTWPSSLGFGEIVRIFMNNLNAPINVTNGAQGITLIDPIRIGDFSFADTRPSLACKSRDPRSTTTCWWRWRSW